MKKLIRQSLALFIATFGLAEEPSKNTSVYFPLSKDGERKNGTITEFEAEWFSAVLKTMGEPPLFPLKDTITAYRFLIIPSFGVATSVRAEFVAGSCKLTSCRMDEKHEVVLGESQMQELSNRLRVLNMFEKPTKFGTEGLDGERWVFEGVADGKYHILNIWCAGAETNKRGLEPFIAVCEFLISHSKLSQRPKNKGRELLPEKDAKKDG